MKKLCLLLFWMSALSAAEVKVPAHIDHSPFTALLQTYVNDQGLVDYKAWKNSPEDLARFENYLKQFASTAPQAKDEDKIASLLNAYNAFTLKLILDHYPIESIRLLKDPFGAPQHLIGGRKVSLDEIEHDTLRPLIGWKVHAMVVCAARSCPPLYSEAYSADDWENQMHSRYRVWLARTDLNSYQPASNTVTISKIFDWYADDYEGQNALPLVLTRYAPASAEAFLQKQTYKIRYQPYHWGLNDQSDLGKNYKHSIFKTLF
ncbi:DUF547 domain-containing protein [Kiritimatiellota bacterium B12222]|nr:DUF547 domain-containing protein [Kiritimatiellota bacterium B12222]